MAGLHKGHTRALQGHGSSPWTTLLALGIAAAIVWGALSEPVWAADVVEAPANDVEAPPTSAEDGGAPPTQAITAAPGGDSDQGSDAKTEGDVAPVAVAVDLQGTPPLLGAPFTYTITLTYPKGVVTHFPPNPALKPYKTVKDGHAVSVSEAAGTVTETHTLTLVSYRVGRKTIPPIEIAYQLASGDTGVVVVPKKRLTIKGRLENELQPSLAAPEEPVVIQQENRALELGLLILLAIIVTAVITAVVILVVGRRLRRRLAPELRLPAHQIALSKLRKIEADGLPAEERYPEFYVRLSEIMRGYCGNRWRFDSLELTTSELARALEGFVPDELQRREILGVIEESDLVKFAKVIPTIEEMETHFATSHRFIDATKLEEEEDDEHVTTPQVGPAPVMTRALGLLTDVAVVSILSGVLSLAGGLASNRYLVALAWGVVFVWLLVRDWRGRSIGKRVWGLELLHDQESPPLTRRRRLVRNLLLALPLLGLVVESISALALPEQRRFGDIVARSRVVTKLGKDGRDPAARVAGVLFLALWVAFANVVIPLVFFGLGL